MSKRDWLKHLGFTTAVAIATSKTIPMSTGKIIISSAQFCKFLSEKMEFWKDEVKIVGTNDELIIDGFKGLLCHIKAPFECTIETGKLRQLKVLLSKMTDQPLTITFDGFKIEIQYITI